MMRCNRFLSRGALVLSGKSGWMGWGCATLGVVLAAAGCGRASPAQDAAHEATEDMAATDPEGASDGGPPITAAENQPAPLADASGNSAGSPEPAPCECATSDALQAIGCGSGQAFRNPVAISDDGATIAFDACPDDAVCRGYHWSAEQGSQALPATSIGSGVTGLSPDGELVLISPSADTFGAEALVYRTSDGRTVRTGLRPEPLALSAEGSVVGLAFDTPSVQLARWSEETGRELLGELPAASRPALVSSPDSAVIFGTFEGPRGGKPFRWTPEDGLVQGVEGIPELSPDPQLTLSRDGSTLFGYRPAADGTPSAFRWTESDGATDLGLPGTANASAIAASADGSIIAISQQLEPNPQCGPGTLCSGALRWTNAAGTEELTSGTPSIASTISSQGTRILGTAGRFSPSLFEWTAGRGARNVQLALEAAGVDATGWQLFSADAVSSDGKVMVGRATCGVTSTVVRIVLPD